jgi:hypothetical protein
VIRSYQSNPHAVVAWWQELSRWVNPDRIPSFPHLPSGWREARVDELVRQIEQKERVEPSAEYNLAGVKWYGEGIFHRERVEGRSLSASFLSPVVPGAFIYNRLFASKASFAVVSDDFGGHFVSTEFPQFHVDQKSVLPHFLYLYFLTEKVLRAVITTSTGSAAVSRNRFKEEEFLQFRLPLPPLPVQKSIVDYWSTARESVESARRLLGQPVAALQKHLAHRQMKAQIASWRETIQKQGPLWNKSPAHGHYARVTAISWRLSRGMTSVWPELDSSLAFRASCSKRALIRSNSSSDNSSMSSSVLCAALVARINSSSFNCTASPSRFWALRIRKIIKKVMMLATVLMTSSQVLPKRNKGPVSAQIKMMPIARPKAVGCPLVRTTVRERV